MKADGRSANMAQYLSSEVAPFREGCATILFHERETDSKTRVARLSRLANMNESGH